MGPRSKVIVRGTGIGCAVPAALFTLMILMFGGLGMLRYLIPMIAVVAAAGLLPGLSMGVAMVLLWRSLQKRPMWRRLTAAGAISGVSIVEVAAFVQYRGGLPPFGIYLLLAPPVFALVGFLLSGPVTTPLEQWPSRRGASRSGSGC